MSLFGQRVPISRNAGDFERVCERVCEEMTVV